MKTYGEINNEIERQNKRFSEICEQVSDFDGFSFLESPFCTLIKKMSEKSYIISYDAPQSDVNYLNNGIMNVIVDEDYIYDVNIVKNNTVAEF